MKNGLYVVMFIAFFALFVGIVTAETQFRLTTDDASESSEYGRSVAIDGNLVAVGMGGDGADGAVYLYKRQGTSYIFEEKLVNPEATEGAEFGRTVAVQGDMVLVGARFAQVDTISQAGAVYVFRKYGDSWHFEDKVVSPSPQSKDNFGRALAVQGDLLVVTARKNSAEKGAAYVYMNTSDGWIYQENLEASDSADGDYFGQSVDLQGNFMVIGARNTEDAGGFYLFRQSRNEWIEIMKVTPPDGNLDDQYGFAIAIAGDKIVVSARRADPAGLNNAGAVYVYSMRGDTVELVTKLMANDAMAKDEFGQSVAIAGNIIAVGAWKDDTSKGSIYLFRQNGDQWIQTDKITASDGISGDEFGYSLAAIGNRVVTGAHKADFISTDGGAAYVILLNQ
jgi:hypothetical protein